MIPAEDLQCLKVIALAGGCKGQIFVSTQTIGELLGTSQQTASRRLKSLEANGLITRAIVADGQHVNVTARGEEELRREYGDYCRIFVEHATAYVLNGTVVSGLGEGKYYMSLAPYKQQFLSLLGFEPYPGTLNIRLAPGSMPARKKVDALSWTRIKGFSPDGRTFGDAKCIACRIGDTPCGIVVPGRTHYPEDIIEVIAPIALRRKLGIEDTDTVSVEVGQ